MITEAHVESLWRGEYTRVERSAMGLDAEDKPRRAMPKRMTIPEATAEALAIFRYLLQRADARNMSPAPVRVVDSSGAVVQQWGKP